MANMQSVATPHMSDAVLKRLLGFASPRRLDASSTLFDAGYERAKADLMDHIEAVLGRQGNHDILRTTTHDRVEHAARTHGASKNGLLSRLLGRA